MFVETACAAIRQKKLLELEYDGFSRRVEPHAVGYSKAGHPIMRAWQVSGGARGECSGLKLIWLDEARSVLLTDEPSQGPRRGYKPGDKALDRIICEI